MKGNPLFDLNQCLDQMWDSFKVITTDNYPAIENFMRAKDRAHEILSHLAGEHEQTRKLAFQVLQEVQALKDLEMENRIRKISFRYASSKYLN